LYYNKIFFNVKPIVVRVQIAFFPFFLIFSFSVSLLSQDIQYSPKEYIDEDGTLYWNKSLPLFLRVSPYENGMGTLLKSKNPAYSNPIYLDTEGTNYIRTKYAVDKESKKTVSPLVEVLMPIVADGTGPKSSIALNNAKKSVSNGIHYYGPGLILSITSVDKLSGLDFIKYNLDNLGYSDFNEDVSVPSQGSHTLSYYAVDKVGNKENTQTSEFVVDLSPPLVTHNINGFANENVIASSSKIYFTASDELSGIDHIFYRFDSGEFRIYNGSHVDFTFLDDGDHVLEYYAIDKVGNQSSTYSYQLYFDKTAPLTASDILGDRFVVKDRIYFSGRTKMKLTAVDNKIGVKEIRYSVDRGEFEVYDQPFYLPSIPGEHRIRYYSVDRLSNQPSGSESYKHNISLLYLDLTGPSIRHRLRGPSFEAAGTNYISPATQIQLVGDDNESGLQYLTYSIDGNSSEIVYNEPFTINTTGLHSIELFGYDNVNNRNVSSAEVFVDASPPEIFENYSARAIGFEDGIPVYPTYVTVYLAATDEIVGNDRIYYSLNGAKEVLYTKPIGQLRKDTKYNVAIRAIDKVGNESTKGIEFKTAAN
jgi:hypothetical protein